MSDPTLLRAERYVQVDRIATGGMGEVWRARDTVLGREVALKILKRELAEDEVFRARFAAEARHAAGLHHPGIATVFDYGTLPDGLPFLVMELVEGKPLSELLGSGRQLDAEQARALVIQAADGLAEAHAAGVVHRDVKPANLMVTPDGVLKITDFGIARAAGAVPITQTGQIIGTPHYLSPEQAEGREATPASDVYALGVLLFECLAGRRPFVADTPVAIALAHIRDEVPELPDDVPADLAAVTRRALAKDPADRYADGAAFSAALRAQPELAPEATQLMPVTQATAAAPVARTPVQRSLTQRQAVLAEALRDRTRWPAYAAGALALLLLGGLLLAHPWSGDDPSGSTATPAGTGSSTTAAPASRTSASPSTVRVVRADYVGRPVDQAARALRQLGLATRTEKQTSTSGQPAGTVADLSPTGRVRDGATITLQVWSDPVVTQATPAPKPTTPDKGPDKGKGKGKKG